jgi:DNA-binding MarR family transcriptional regulator
MVRPLLVNGFIDKFYMFGDKRKIYLKISDKGKENVEKIKVSFDRMAKRSLSKVPAGKRDLTFQMVNELIKAVI